VKERSYVPRETAVRWAVVPAAGRGTRMLPATRAVPKELLPLGTTPVIDLVLAELAAAGIAETVLVTAPGKSALETHVARGAVAATFVHQPAPRGLGDAVLCAEPVVGAVPFVVALPYALLAPQATARAVRAVASGEVDGAIVVEHVLPEAAARYAMVALDGDGLIGELVEKPGPSWGRGDLAVSARYVLPSAVFAALRATSPGHGGEVQLTDAIAALLADGARFAAVELPDGDRRRDVGSPSGYSAAFVQHVLSDPGLAEGVEALLDGRVRR
jgi:UTP--glucose-1-phosphate uridylyltransferase